MPVLVGWAAVTDRLGWAPLVLFAVIVIWTPPHFWALAIRYRDDYAAAQRPHAPGGGHLAAHGPADPRLHRAAGGGDACSSRRWATWAPLYLVGALVLGALFIVLRPAAAARADAERAAMALFRYSITYLTLLFVAMAGDVLIRFH